MAQKVAGTLYESITGQLFEIARQLRQKGGYAFDPEALQDHLQLAVEGRFVVPKWQKENGVIYFSVTSDGTNGPGWIKELDCTNYAKSILNSKDFKPTSGITTQIAVLKGNLFKDNERITKIIREKAENGVFTKGKKLCNPNAEVACLIRRKFTNKEIEKMGLYWIVTMHNPIKDFDGGPRLLGTDRSGGSRLYAYGGDSGYEWDSSDGFAFLFPQV